MLKRYLIIIVLGILVLPALLHADDTDIYGTVTSVDVKPNVLIIFDTSGSMTHQDIPGEDYDSNKTYNGSDNRNTDKFYEYKQFLIWSWWDEYDNLSDWDETNEDYQTLVDEGQLTRSWCDCTNSDSCPDYEYIGPIEGSCPSGFATLSSTIATGNFLNYENDDSIPMLTRNKAARQSLRGIIDTYYDSVNLGLMRLNGEDGGKLLYGCGKASKEVLLAAMDDDSEIKKPDPPNILPADGYTPLGEALAEAGLYFAGMSSWYDDDKVGEYVSPISSPCQNNFIILMTDGEPYYDGDKLEEAYINGDHIDSGTDEESAQRVAKYLYNKDVNPDHESDQNIRTFTIGFSSGAADAAEVLRNTASNGGGEDYQASSISGLSIAFADILSGTLEETTIFAAPVVPVNRLQRTGDSNLLYLAFFQPVKDEPWIGNLKKFQLNPEGQIVNEGNVLQTKENSELKQNSQDLWAIDEGGAVNQGGAGGKLMSRATARNLYTYLQDAPSHSTVLSSATNSFIKTNDDLNTTLTALYPGLTETEFNTLVDDIHGEGKAWKMGDIIHCEPAVVHYPETAPGDVTTAVYAGANSGMIHSINDLNGSELWGFIPPGQLSRLNLMQTAENNYFIDGHITVTYGAQDLTDLSLLPSPEIMIFGERRGGSNYYALNIINPESPVWRYKIEASYQGLNLGQSWGKVLDRTIVTHVEDGTPMKEDVFIFSGGYDEHQDTEEWQTEDHKGRAVFATRQDISGSATPELLKNFADTSDGWVKPSHSILDVNAVDRKGYGTTSRLYFGDMGGNVYAIADDVAVERNESGETAPTGEIVPADGEWNAKLKLFSASTAGIAGGPVAPEDQRKIMYAPARAHVRGFDDEFIFFGTGNRANPSKIGVTNRFYAVRNDWTPNSSNLTANDDLFNVTGVSVDEAEQLVGETIIEDFNEKKGWYFDLVYAHQGEKVVSAPIVFNGLVIFTTYTPPVVDEVVDPASTSCIPRRGKGRLYVVYADNGSAWFNKDGNTELEPDERPTELPEHLPLGTPMIVKDRVQVGTWSSPPLPAPLRESMKYFYWRKAN